jgi:beta-galactosidase
MKRGLGVAAGVLLLAMAFTVTLPVGGLAATASMRDVGRQDTQLVDGWRFHKGDVTGAEDPAFDDSGWDAVTLPHTWNAIDGQQDPNYYRGPGWYRRHVSLDPALDRRQYLQFDGSNLITDVYANGSLLGEHRGGYAGFRFDATGLISAVKDNVIAVKVNNARNSDVPPLSADYTFYGGLYRMVHLVATAPVHLSMTDFGSSGIYLKPTSVSARSADLEVTTRVVNDSAQARSVGLETVIKDQAGSTVARLSSEEVVGAGAEHDFVQSTSIAGPHLWDGRADPYVYTAEVAVLDGARPVDGLTQPLGFRYFSVDADQGFFLNGRYHDLHGANKHQDRLDKGWAVSEADQDEDFALMEEIGATALRMAHYQHAQHEYDLADHDGLVVWAELALVNNITASQAFTDNAIQQLKELIRQNYNHPSIFFWSISNEVGGSPDPRPLQRLLNDVVHSEDSTRLSTHASAGGDPNIDTDVYGSNRYYGWYYGSYNDFGPWADSNHTGHPDRQTGISEYGAGASIYFHSETPVRQDHTEEYQNLFHEAHWQQMAARSYLWGKLVWNMFDFASAGRNEGDTRARNDKGLATFDRQTRKDSFYWYRANWSDQPFTYLTSRRFNPRTQARTTVKVYSNTDSVELFLNGQSVSVQSSDNHIFSWDVTLVPGDNSAVAVGVRDQTKYTDSVTWTLQTPTDTVARIDSGSASAYTDTEGNVWDADRAYAGGTPGSRRHEVGGTDDPDLYLTYRFGNFSYSLPLANGTYDLCLRFMEPYWIQAGQRVFSVTAQGQALLTNFDIYSQVGQFYALDRCFVVDVTDYALQITFTASVDNGIISALSAIRRE